MKKIPLIAAALTLIAWAAPASAESVAPEAPACVTAAVEAAPAVAPLDTDPVFASHGGCHVSADCECGRISCEGQKCDSGSNSVTCDNQTTYCPSSLPSCSASTSCPDGSFISCSATNCAPDCIKEDGCWVACDENQDGFGIEDFTWCPGFEGCLTCPCDGGFG